MGNRQSGYVALLAVLIVGAAATAVAVALLATGADSQRSALVVQQSRQARALAVACAEEASQTVHDNIAFSGTNSLSLGQGNCTYIVGQPTATTRILSATGTVAAVTRKLTATATVNASTITLSAWKDASANGPSTPAFVQVASATPQSSPSSVAVAYPAAEAAGDTNVIAIGWNNTTSTITSVADSLGNTYAIAAPITRGTNLSQAMYYAKNVVAGTPTVTVTFNTTTSFPDLRIMEYSGLDTAAPFNTSVSLPGANNPGGTGTLSTTVPTALLVAAGTTSVTFTAPGAGFTQRVITSPNADIVEDRVVTTSGAYAGSATGSGNWVMQMVALKAAGQ
ncbi:MAG TPA: hypothetical protein VLF71_00540 [Candidatus Saccharimonadales bacterium]|nr:hypothetical protein [Candidatus Saccharimonadales bacterium]